MSGRILVIDDEELFCRDLAQILEEEGHRCATAHTGEHGLALARELSPNVVLCDLMLPGIDGVEVADRLARICPEASLILITAFGTMESAIDAFRKGVSDYLLKPLVLDDLLRKVNRCLEEGRLRREVGSLRRALADLRASTRLVGESPPMKELSGLIAKLAVADCTVLIAGESGTGKELVARELHDSGPRAKGPFLAVNSAALPRDLIEAELFGHARGAFTGAASDRKGYFQLADGGTLFLDEIGELPLDLQPKLLRALESRAVNPVGSGHPVPVDVRIVAATHRDLAAEISAGRFRSDLYYRIRVVQLDIPPLRERREDIPLLAEHLVTRLCRRLGRRLVRIEEDAMELLRRAPWPGNVRELENALERAILLSESESITSQDLPPELSSQGSREVMSDSLREAAAEFEQRHIRRVLAEAGGNREEAARRLGINASTLYRRLRALDASRGPV